MGTLLGSFLTAQKLGCALALHVCHSPRHEHAHCHTFPHLLVRTARVAAQHSSMLALCPRHPAHAELLDVARGRQSGRRLASPPTSSYLTPRARGGAAPFASWQHSQSPQYLRAASVARRGQCLLARRLRLTPALDVSTGMHHTQQSRRRACPCALIA
jgi:hypothetical protein